MKIYTGTGDNGETGLFGGERVLKSDLRVEAYGSVDELNAFIGLTITELKDEDIKKTLLKIQNQLFTVGSDLSTPDTEKNKKLNIPRAPQSFYTEVETLIDKYSAELEELKYFILPGGSKAAALMHVCRTVCRKAERTIVELNSKEKIGNSIIIFLNRLSDLFFVLARYVNKQSDVPDVKWEQ
jgi:cob(I)alamin adenosyltransferase